MLAIPLLTSAQGPAGRATVLRLAVPTSLGAPLVDWDEQQVRGGVIPRLARHVSDSHGLRLELIALPPARLRSEVLAGQYDAVCLPSSQRGSERDALEWAAPVLEISELLVAHGEVPRLEQLADAEADSMVGIVQGLTLPALDGRLRREDALSEDRLAKKLAARRHPYAVISQPAASYWRAQGLSLAGWTLLLDRVRLQCGLSSASPVSAAQWSQAQEAARQSGLLAQLARQALMPGFALVVSRASELRVIPEQQLVDLYLGRRQSIAGGHSPRLLMLGGTLRSDATRQLLQREPTEYAAQWTAQQFGGRRRAPEEFEDPVALRAALRQDPKALGVLPLWALDASVRVLGFR